MVFSLRLATSSGARSAPFDAAIFKPASEDEADPASSAFAAAWSFTIWAKVGVVANHSRPTAPATSKASIVSDTHSIFPCTSRYMSDFSRLNMSDTALPVRQSTRSRTDTAVHELHEIVFDVALEHAQL